MLIVTITVMLFCLWVLVNVSLDSIRTPAGCPYERPTVETSKSFRFWQLARVDVYHFVEENEVQIKKAYGQPVETSQRDINNVTSRRSARSMDRSRK